MTEEQEQMVFVEWLAIRHIPYFHCPNEVGGRTKSLRARAVKMKRMGVSKGVPDLFVFIPLKPGSDDSRAYQMCAIEMKRVRGGRTTAEQFVWIQTLKAAGVPSKVCKGAEEAIEFVESVRKGTAE